MESPVELKRRISEVTRYVPLERLGLSPQCGFASSIIGNKISFGEQRLKLKLVVESSKEIWG